MKRHLLLLACVLAGALAWAARCPAQDEAKDAEIRLLRAENNLLKKQLAETKAKLEASAAKTAPRPAAGGATTRTTQPGSQPAGGASEDLQPTVNLTLCENNPNWWTDVSLFAMELQLRDAPAVQARYPDETRANWLNRHGTFIGHQVRWTLGLLEANPMPEEEAGRLYYQRMADLKPVNEQIATLRKVSPQTDAVRADIAAAEQRARSIDADAQAWKKALDNKGGVVLRCAYREMQNNVPVEVFYVRTIVPAGELDKIKAYGEQRTKENPLLHASLRAWPILVTGTIASWGGNPAQPELGIDGSWAPSTAKIPGAPEPAPSPPKPR